jgi:hypothetical protein
VVTTYAATAYIVIEVTNNLAVVTPSRLDSTLILTGLLIGLPVVIFCHGYLILPPEIKKTESFEELGKQRN